MFSTKYFVICILFLIPVALADDDDDCPSKGGVQETLKKLKNDILCNYDRSFRPVLDSKTTVVVTIAIMFKFFEFTDLSNQMQINYWLVLKWNDEYLNWKPADYNGIPNFHIDTDSIWIPDISIYNSADMSSSRTSMSGFSCMLRATGNITCVIPIRHDALCKSNVKQWPFDTQKCTVRVGSWIYSGEEVGFRLVKPSVSLGDYTPNREWELISANASINPGVIICCPNRTYPHIDYKFNIVRHATAITTTTIIPAAIFAVITLAAMFASWDSQERYFFCGLNLVLHLLILENLVWILPPNGLECPIILTYFKDSLLMAAFGILEGLFLRYISTSSLTTSNWLTAFINMMVNCRPGQILLLSKLDPKAVAAATGTNTEEGGDLVVNVPTPGCSKEWLILVNFIDRICFIGYILAYIIMGALIIPKPS
uniref:Nicotinic acetylcholine receptor alpha9 n=1 Tax=Protohermes xanthodes TaxID=1452977 RepID=A0AAU6PBN0_9NEOP